MVSAGITEHLKRLSADTDEVILATCALAAARAGRAPVAGGGDVPVGSAASTRELEKELAAAKEELRGHEGRVAEWERKVASAEDAQKVAAEAFKKGQKDIQMFRDQCAKLEEEAKAAKAAQAAAEKRTTEANDSSPLSICLRCICGGLCAHVCAAAQAESGSGLRHTADELRKELESVRANMTGAIPAAAHNLMLSELKQVMHTPGPLFPLLLACSSCCSCRGACPALLSCALDLVHARSAESA
jgi:hypothetical protein